MIVGLGIDLVEVARIRSMYERHGGRFLQRILTPAEQQYVLGQRDPTTRLAGRWAAKEAALKALGTGLAEGLTWHEVEALPDQFGRPVLHLHGAALRRAEALGARGYHLSITHSGGLAMAEVILDG